MSGVVGTPVRRNTVSSPRWVEAVGANNTPEMLP